jgi:dephospho-CoA kinase
VPAGDEPAGEDPAATE